jgi:hypothetical protein
MHLLEALLTRPGVDREHHQHDREQTLDFDDIAMDGIGSGALNAWLPDDIELTETAVRVDCLLAATFPSYMLDSCRASCACTTPAASR